MRVTFATESGDPSRTNEDFIAASSEAIVILDGAGAAESGCIHGVPWYVRTLGSNLLDGLSQSDGTLTEILAEGIKAVTSAHDFTCDLDHPGCPSASVALVRRRAGLLDWLVLSGLTLVLQLTDEQDPVVIRDARTPIHSSGTMPHTASHASLHTSPHAEPSSGDDPHEETIHALLERLLRNAATPSATSDANLTPTAEALLATSDDPSATSDDPLATSDDPLATSDEFLATSDEDLLTTSDELLATSDELLATSDEDLLTTSDELLAISSDGLLSALGDPPSEDPTTRVAATDPLAADDALTGSVPLAQVRAAAALTPGAAGLADHFPWRYVVTVLTQLGPAAVIQRAHAAQRPADPSEDATAVYISDLA